MQRHPDSVDVTLQRLKSRKINQQVLVKVATLKLKWLELLSCIDRASPLTKGGCNLPNRGKPRQFSKLRCPQRRSRMLRGQTRESPASTHDLCVEGKRTIDRQTGERQSDDGFKVVGQGSAACHAVAAHYDDQCFR